MKSKANVYSSDSTRVTVKGYKPVAQAVPYGTDVKGIYFDGYPQVVKHEESPPVYKIKKEKDIIVACATEYARLVDVYRPDVEGEKFPAILAWGGWGKDAQEAIEWNYDKPQPY